TEEQSRHAGAGRAGHPPRLRGHQAQHQGRQGGQDRQQRSREYCGGVAGRAVDQGRGGDQRGQQQRRGGPEGGGGGGRRRQQAVAREPVAVHHPFGLLVGLVGADREQAGGHRRQRGPEEEGEAQPAVPDGIADLGGGGEGRDRQKRG